MRKFSIAITLSVLMIAFASCEDDPIEVGSEIFGEDHFGFEKYEVQSTNASIVNTGIVATRNLSKNALGVYHHQVFGTTKAHIVTQIGAGSDILSSVGENPVLDSVYIYIPYESTVTATDADGVSTYSLSDVNGEGVFDLSVYENGYFLRTQDPNNNFDTQLYYSDQKDMFDSNKTGINGTQRLNNSENTAQNTAFKASADAIVLYAYNADGTPKLDENGNHTVKERKAPGIWLDLDKDYFQQRFFDSNAYKSITNDDQLRTFFRGLYFNANAVNGQNLMTQLGLEEGELVFIYKEDGTDDGQRERKTITFNLGYSTTSSNTRTNTTVNLFENTNSDAYNTALNSSPNDLLWIRGNEGSLAEITLMDEAELEQIRENNWLVNQAVLTLYVNQSAMGSEDGLNPERLYLYDFTNNSVIADYTNDATTSPYKQIYNGFIDRSEENVVKYRFRITDHINNLIQRDSTNIKLGVVATNDITSTLFTMLKNQSVHPGKLPLGASSMPFGTVINGPQHADSSKRMKLEIYYTKENE